MTVASTGAVIKEAIPGEFESAALQGTSVFESGVILSNPVITPTVLPPTTFDGTSVQPCLTEVSFLFYSEVSLFGASIEGGLTSPPLTLVSTAVYSPASTTQSEVAVLTPSSTE